MPGLLLLRDALWGWQDFQLSFQVLLFQFRKNSKLILSKQTVILTFYKLLTMKFPNHK